MAQITQDMTLSEASSVIANMREGELDAVDFVNLLYVLTNSDNISMNDGDALQDAVDSIETDLNNAFDKTSDGDSDITNFTALDDAIKVSEDDTLYDVIVTINDALGGKSDSDTNTDTAAGISIADSGDYTSEDYVEGALQEIYGNSGFPSNISSEMNNWRLFKQKSSYWGALTSLHEQIIANYQSILEGSEIYNHRIIYTDTGVPSLPEYTITNITYAREQTAVIVKGTGDMYLVMDFQAKTDIVGTDMVELNIGQSEGKNIEITNTSYEEKQIKIPLSGISDGIYEVHFSGVADSGHTINIKWVNISVQGA